MTRNANQIAVCEYGTLSAFLTALSQTGPAEILLAPAHHRPIPTASTIQAGALLSGQRPGEPSCVHTCLVRAVQAILVGTQGRITYPYCQKQANAHVRQRIHDLQQEFLDTLQISLSSDQRVAHLQYPASFQVSVQLWAPDALVGYPVTFQGEHWTIVSRKTEQSA